MSTAPASHTRFGDYAETHSGMHNELPLVHSTLCEHLEFIAESNALDVRECPVFHEPLVYLFYGRPAYRSRHGHVADTAIHYCPVCFILKPKKLHALPCRVFPFDSGAAKSDRFAPYIAAENAERFELPPQIEAIRRFTHKFFETNGDYFVGNPRSDLVIPNDDQEAKQFYSLIASEGTADFDDRRSAIELQYRDAVVLSDSLWAVVLPTSFLQNQEIRRRIVSEWGAFPITYPTFRGASPAEYNSVIRQKYHDWLVQGGFLS